jgi:hypothetical protein
MIPAPAEAGKNISNVTDADKSVFTMRLISLLVLIFFSIAAGAQALKKDTLKNGRVIIEKDPRIDVLGEKMTEYNQALTRKTRMENGYRLMLLSSADRDKVMALRTRLLQIYPDQKVYTVFQTPYIKLKFGNFLDKEEAEKMKKQLMSMKLVEGNIYVVPEKVEVKPDKKDEELQGD